jgi:aldehyde dehydrogenase (NAD+)
MAKTIRDFYGDVSVYNDNMTHIVNARHFDRLVKAINECGGTKIVEGMRDRDRLYIGPNLIESPTMTSELMTEEIFGPIMPFFKVSGPEEAIEYVNQREKPLALYVMSGNSKVFDMFVEKTSSGAAFMNETVAHCSSPYPPFGGVGNSGMGKYRGKAGFKSLSHHKTVMTHSTLIDPTIRYPPYQDKWLKFLKAFV